jgi:hypothetical protein
LPVIERVQITTTSSITKTPILDWQHFTLVSGFNLLPTTIWSVLLINDVAAAAESVIFIAGVTTFRGRF